MKEEKWMFQHVEEIATKQQAKEYGKEFKKLKRALKREFNFDEFRVKEKKTKNS